ncbi:anaerobic ribonucleoside-triphosphate reductase, partial [Herbiconiux daphne]
MTQVIKRDGSTVFFSVDRIINAVKAAQEAANNSRKSLAYAVAHAVIDRIAYMDTINIAEIQDWVEQALMEEAPDVARKYIEYRHERDRVREGKSQLAQSIKGLITLTDKAIVNENANKDAKVFPVQRDLMAGIVSKHFAHSILPADVLKAHEDGDIHFHDMDYSPFLPMTNCCLVDLKGMLENGFKLGNAQIESPKSIGVACAVMAQITAQVASHQYGGTTFANIDQVLAPYAEKSYNKWLTTAQEWQITDPVAFAKQRTAKEIYDGIQAYEYEV